jgi:hypothetical protein
VLDLRLLGWGGVLLRLRWLGSLDPIQLSHALFMSTKFRTGFSDGGTPSQEPTLFMAAVQSSTGAVWPCTCNKYIHTL